MASFGQILKQVQQVQENVRAVVTELAEARFEGEAGGGAVKVTMNGHKQVQELKIDPAAVDPNDVETLEDLIVAALRNATDAAEKGKLEKMQAATAGLPIPPELLGI